MKLISHNNSKKEKKHVFHWLDKPKSGKRTSAVLWILTFSVTFMFAVLSVLLDFFLSMAGKPIAIDFRFLEQWVHFIEAWIYGLIWFSGFIVAGTTINGMVTKGREDADQFMQDLTSIKSQRLPSPTVGPIMPQPLQPQVQVQVNPLQTPQQPQQQPLQPQSSNTPPKIFG